MFTRSPVQLKFSGKLTAASTIFLFFLHSFYLHNAAVADGRGAADARDENRGGRDGQLPAIR
jgi:hypothetical protein